MIKLLTALLLCFVFSSGIAIEFGADSFYSQAIASDVVHPFLDKQISDKQISVIPKPLSPPYTENALTFTFFGNHEDRDPPAAGTFTAMVTLPNQEVRVVTVPFDSSASISIPAPSPAGVYGIGVYANREFSGVTNAQTVTVTSSGGVDLLFHFNLFRIPNMLETTVYINAPSAISD